MKIFRRKKYLVFRRYSRPGPNPHDYEKIEDMPDPETWKINEQFAQHFVSPLTLKEARKAVDIAKYQQPWQEFVILPEIK